jgi:dTDP-4-amino-4,6-dideoxygalactose transaminase
MKLVSNQINPHFTLLDSLHAVGSLVIGQGHTKLDSFFEQEFYTKNIVFTNTARSALGLICDTVNPDKGKRIALPAFICAVVATPFLARGYEIEWIDTDDNGLIDVEDFKAKAGKVSLVVVPHIFGQLSPLKAIKEIAVEHDIFVVEDSAHAIRQFLPHYKPLADAQILSFGREKVISCVSGGALIWPENASYHQAFSALKNKLRKPSLSWVFRHALQPLIFSLSLPWWHHGGKIIPWLARKIKLLPLAVTSAEKKGLEDFPVTALGLPQKRILARQIELHEVRTIHAQAMALAWCQTLEPNFPTENFIIPTNAFRTLMLAKAPHTKEDLLFELKQAQAPYHLSDWDGVPISPQGVHYKKFFYRPGQCPSAEYFARTYLTFPTNIRTNKADIKAFAKYVKAH